MLLKLNQFIRHFFPWGKQRNCLPDESEWNSLFAKKPSEFAEKKENLTFISGYYEGVDHRVTEQLVDVELSLGNYVLSSGDLPSLCVSDSVIRLLPGFMGDAYGSLVDESHNKEGQLEYPQYTKPQNYNEWMVPEVLMSGNHSEISKWKEKNRKANESLTKGIEHEPRNR